MINYKLFIDPCPDIVKVNGVPNIKFNIKIGSIQGDFPLLIQNKRYAGYHIKAIDDDLVYIVPKFRVYKNKEELSKYFKRYYDNCIDVSLKRLQNHKYEIDKVYYKGIGSSSVSLYNNLVQQREDNYEMIDKVCSDYENMIVEKVQYTVFDIL